MRFSEKMLQDYPNYQELIIQHSQTLSQYKVEKKII